MQKEAKIYVDNMTCRNCAKILRNALSTIDGILNMTIDLPKKRMIIKYDSKKVEQELILGIIKSKGYASEVID